MMERVAGLLISMVVFIVSYALDSVYDKINDMIGQNIIDTIASQFGITGTGHLISSLFKFSEAFSGLFVVLFIVLIIVEILHEIKA